MQLKKNQAIFPLNSPASHYPALADALLQAQVLPQQRGAKKKKQKTKQLAERRKWHLAGAGTLCYFVGALFTKSLYLPTRAGNHKR